MSLWSRSTASWRRAWQPESSMCSTHLSHAAGQCGGWSKAHLPPIYTEMQLCKVSGAWWARTIPKPHRRGWSNLFSLKVTYSFHCLQLIQTPISSRVSSTILSQTYILWLPTYYLEQSLYNRRNCQCSKWIILRLACDSLCRRGGFSPQWQRGSWVSWQETILVWNDKYPGSSVPMWSTHLHFLNL